MALPPITVEPLGRQHDRTAFHCGAQALDRYLQQQARQDADKRVAAPFVAVRPTDGRVLGYYTLSASVLTLPDLPDELARKLPRYPQLPVTLLGRLAVDQSTKGQGLGEHLLLDALRRSLAHADQIAAMAVVVDAKDEAAAAFYRHYGFGTLQAQPSRLFVPMRSVAQLLG
ncbi:MAG: GNAT family N-acetyltransferase [Betaproteobacteria bacterium]|nr:GNAT family N-acetyltransferase [Betaproteobacteria bacterium]